MLQRIKTDSTKAPRGIVTNKVRDNAVRRLMKRNRDEDWDNPDRGQIDEIGCHSFGQSDLKRANKAALLLRARTKSTAKEATNELTALEAKRTALIGQLELRPVADRDG